MNFSQHIKKINLHRLLATYQKYFDRFFLNTNKVKILKNKVVRIQRILILGRLILKIIKINNMKKIQSIIKKYNKIIFKISFINNFTNLKFYNFFVLSSHFDRIKKKSLQFPCYITDILRKSNFEMI